MDHPSQEPSCDWPGALAHLVRATGTLLTALRALTISPVDDDEINALVSDRTARRRRRLLRSAPA
jgi:hypothetical protein